MAQSWPGEVIHGTEEDFLNAQASPTQAAPVASAQPQGAPVDQSQQFPGTPIDAAPQTQAGFSDELPETPRSQMAPEDEAQLAQLKRTGSARDITAFMASKGYAPTVDMDAWVADRDKRVAAGEPIDANTYYDFPKVEKANAGTAYQDGITSFIPGRDMFAAATGAAYDAATGSDRSFGENYDRRRDTLDAQSTAARTEHPGTYYTSGLLGGMFVPTGLEGVGFQAGNAALRAGKTMAEARVIAAQAVRDRSIIGGALYGGAHGGLDGRTPGEAFTGALVEGGLGALAGGVLGQVGVGVARRNAGPVEGPIDYRAIAERLGINATPATVGGRGAQAAQMGFGNVPGGMGVVSNAVERETAGLENATRAAAADIGPVSTRQGAGEAVASGANSYAQSSKAETKALYEARDELFGGTSAPVALNNVRGTYAQIARDFPTSPALAALNEHPVLRRLSTALPDEGPITLSEATDALSHVRGVKRNLQRQNNASGPLLARVGKIEQALEDDVVAAGRRADMAAGRTPGAEGSAVAAQAKADAAYADRKATLNGALKTAYDSSRDPVAVSGEAVYNRLLADTGRKGGNLARLRQTWFRLPADAKNTFAATMLDDLGRATKSGQDDLGSAWSFQTFLSNLDDMAPQARNILFGAKAQEQIKDIAAYASRLRDLDKSRNFSNTAKNLITGGIVTTVLGSLFHGQLGQAGLEAAIPIGAAAGAKLFLATPAMRNWTSDAFKIAASPVASQSRAAAKSLVDRLPAIARANPVIANDVLGLQRQLMDRFAGMPLRAAAADEPLEGQGNAGDQYPDSQGLQP